MNKGVPINVAFCTVPHVGGIYSVYQKLRVSLKDRGWNVLGVQVGDENARWEIREDLADDGIRKVVPNETDLRTAAVDFCQWVKRENISIVIPMSCPAALAAVPHLPANVRVITRCISIGTQSCRLVASNMNRTSRIVYTSPAQREELELRFKVSEDKFCHLPNAVDTNLFCPEDRQNQSTTPLNVIYVGRLAQRQKNIFALPEICRFTHEMGVPLCLTIVGSGSDEAALRLKLKEEIENDTVRFAGAVPHNVLIPMMQESDCLLLPSSEEGFPNTMVEAMSCGLVPVVSKLPGITDWVVEDGVNGLLGDHQNPATFAKHLKFLHEFPDRRVEIGKSSRDTVVAQLSIEVFAEGWSKLFTEVLSEPSLVSTPRSWDQFQPSPAFKPAKYGWLPANWRAAAHRSLAAIGWHTR